MDAVGAEGIMANKIILELNEVQAKVISVGCEILARIQMGQLDEVAMQLFHLHSAKDPEMSKLWDMLKTRLEDAESVVGALYGTKGYHPGIHSEKLPDTARVAFDIHRVMRHQLWQLRDGDRCHSCNDAYSATQTSQQPLPVCSIKEEEGE